MYNELKRKLAEVSVGKLAYSDSHLTLAEVPLCPKMPIYAHA